MDRMPLKQLMKYFVNHPVPPIGAMIPLARQTSALAFYRATLLHIILWISN